MTQHQLVMRTGPTPGKVFELTQAELTLGREPGNDVVINDSEISRKHARLALQGESYILEDLGSTNGTFVNGQRLTGPHELRPGEIIAFGEQISCTYEQVGAEPAQDPNATIISSKGSVTTMPPTPQPATAPPPPPPPTTAAAQAMPPSQPKPAATPAPSQPRPTAPPAPGASQPKPAAPPAAFAGKVPAGPEKAAAKPPAQKGRSPVMVVVIVVLVLCILCACLLFFSLRFIDSDPTGSRWCQYLPFIVNLIGGSCG